MKKNTTPAILQDTERNSTSTASAYAGIVSRTVDRITPYTIKREQVSSKPDKENPYINHPVINMNNVQLSYTGSTTEQELVNNLSGVPVETKKIFKFLATELSSKLSGKIYPFSEYKQIKFEEIQITLTTKQIKDELGIKNNKRAKDTILKAREDLSNLLFFGSALMSDNEPGKRKRKELEKEIGGSIILPMREDESVKGKFTFFFNPQLLPFISQFNEPYNRKVFLLDTQYHRLAWDIYFYLNEKYHRQDGEMKKSSAHKRKPVIISTLIKYINLPAPEQVKNYKYIEKIEDPLIKELQYLQGNPQNLIENLYLMNPKTKEKYILSDPTTEQKDAGFKGPEELKALSIKEFIDLRIYYEMTE